MSVFRIFCIGGFIGMLGISTWIHIDSAHKGTPLACLQTIGSFLLFGAVAVALFGKKAHDPR